MDVLFKSGRKGLLRRCQQFAAMMALEPRMMFDGAVVDEHVVVNLEMPCVRIKIVSVEIT